MKITITRGQIRFKGFIRPIILEVSDQITFGELKDQVIEKLKMLESYPDARDLILITVEKTDGDKKVFIKIKASDAPDNTLFSNMVEDLNPTIYINMALRLSLHPSSPLAQQHTETSSQAVISKDPVILKGRSCCLQ